MGVDVLDAPAEPLMKICAKTDLALLTEMDVRNLDDFHSATFSSKSQEEKLFRLPTIVSGNQCAGTGTEALRRSSRVPVSDEKRCMASGENSRPTALPGSGWTASEVTTENGAPSRST